MRVLVAGASGAVGKQLIPQLGARGYEVAGLVRSSSGAACVAAKGVEPIVANALDRAEVWRAVREFRPDAIIHQLTALPANLDLRNFDAVFAQTNRLRTEGTDNLLSAAREFGVRRFVAQSFCGCTYARSGGNAKMEDDPLDPHPPAAFRRTLRAIRYLEKATCAAQDVAGVCLRYGFSMGQVHLSARMDRRSNRYAGGVFPSSDAAMQSGHCFIAKMRLVHASQHWRAMQQEFTMS
jgi:nucleoside-diphosphate-sugar epimerase